MKTSESPHTDQVRILVVDDHPNTAATLARALAQLGPSVDVVSAASGREALDKVKNKGVDILFTDMIMPEMTGLELIEKMKNHPAGRPAYTYLVTAYDVPGLKVTAQRLKVNEVIVKPVRPERICQIATQAMEEMNNVSKPVGQPAAKRKFKILIADDWPDNVTLLVRYLEYEGYAQVSARDGVETLEKVRDEMPDLVLLDINMPLKDGFAVLSEIRSDPAISHIPVIILTAARLDATDVQSGLNLGADDYVTKPFERHELMARIRTKLRVKEAEDVIRRRNRELNLLPEIGRELSARTDIKDLANILLKRTVETLGAIQGNMIILQNEGSAQQNYQVSLSPEDESNHKLEIPQSLIDHMKAEPQGLVVNNAQNNPLWQMDVNPFIGSAVVAPLNGRHELLGLIILAHEQEQYFNTDHLLLLQAIASQASIAMENARLYADVAQEQKRLAVILQHAAEAILLFDESGKLCLLNPAGEKLFTDFNTRINEPLPSDAGYEKFVAMLNEARVSRLSSSGEVTWPDQRTFMALITPIEDGGQVAILHDVTHFKDLEKVKNEFIATASHDLKNPITTISGFSSLLEQAGPLNAQQHEFLNYIKSASSIMTELVQNMMSLAQMDLDIQKKYVSVDMQKLLGEMADEFTPQAHKKEQSLKFTPLSAPVHVNGDPLQLRQLLRNLLGNAIKYTPVGGNIQLYTKADDAQISIHVQDNGFGIPTQDLPFIFDRFYRVRDGKASEAEGNGLGLAIVKSIVEGHNGTINVESEVGKGTCFTLSLPLV
ncbi:MAG: response regulator [Anaerolineales bacterium]|nr:response regulator [Anaerolineales bacterium]